MKEKQSQRLVFHLTWLCFVIAILLHSYLAYRHYMINLSELPEKSICTINDYFDCDTVSISAYSKFLGIPIALWGAITNFLTLMLFLYYSFGSSKDALLGRFVLLMGGGILSASIVMAVLSITKMNVFCLFCIATYIVSIITFIGLMKLIPGPYFNFFSNDIKEIITTRRGLIGFLIAIPLITLFTNSIMWDSFGKRAKKGIEEALAYWKTESPIDVDIKYSLHKGSTQSKMTIIEFADYSCPHCKAAAHSIKLFLKAHPDVSFYFLVFPLDGMCNSEIPHSREYPCLIAKTVFCADKYNKTWETHDWFFDKQSEIRSRNNFDSSLIQMTKELNLNLEQINNCIESEEAKEAIAYQIEQGKKAQIQGTPSFFINQQRLTSGQILLTLDSIYSEIFH